MEIYTFLGNHAEVCGASTSDKFTRPQLHCIPPQESKHAFSPARELHCHLAVLVLEDTTKDKLEILKFGRTLLKRERIYRFASLLNGDVDSGQR